MIQEITPFGSISYAYDELGRRTSMQVAGQAAVNYNYDENSRLTSVVGAGLVPAQIAYDALGRRTSLTLPNGVTTNYTYDNASRLLNLEHLNPLNSILEKVSYAYDTNSSRTSMNRLNVAPQLPNPASSITYNAANQMLTFTPQTGSAKNMTYDENGNMTSMTNTCRTTTYSWNARNQLTGINGFKPDCSSLTANFKYDALGRRIEKTINGKTINYLYDGMDIIQEIENGTVSANYIRTLNIDEPLARLTPNALRFYQTDALGSVIALTDEASVVKTQYNYDPFGNTEMIGEPSDNPFQYAGRENDGTGLLFERNRYYSFELQRYISEDPIGLAGGDINFFVRVGNNPVNFVDPWGLLCTYNQRTGHLVCSTGIGLGIPYVDTTGYSGRGIGKNNPNKEGVPNIGPIPRGCWRIGAPRRGGNTGPVSLPLTPLFSSGVFSTRDPSSFYIHGDSTDPNRFGDASKGCPIIGRSSRERILEGEILCVY